MKLRAFIDNSFPYEYESKDWPEIAAIESLGDEGCGRKFITVRRNQQRWLITGRSRRGVRFGTIQVGSDAVIKYLKFLIDATLFEECDIHELIYKLPPMPLT